MITIKFKNKRLEEKNIDSINRLFYSKYEKIAENVRRLGYNTEMFVKHVDSCRSSGQTLFSAVADFGRIFGIEESIRDLDVKLVAKFDEEIPFTTIFGRGLWKHMSVIRKDSGGVHTLNTFTHSTVNKFSADLKIRDENYKSIVEPHNIFISDVDIFGKQKKQFLSAWEHGLLKNIKTRMNTYEEGHQYLVDQFTPIFAALYLMEKTDNGKFLHGMDREGNGFCVHVYKESYMFLKYKVLREDGFVLQNFYHRIKLEVESNRLMSDGVYILKGGVPVDSNLQNSNTHTYLEFLIQVRGNDAIFTSEAESLQIFDKDIVPYFRENGVLKEAKLNEKVIKGAQDLIFNYYKEKKADVVGVKINDVSQIMKDKLAVFKPTMEDIANEMQSVFNNH